MIIMHMHGRALGTPRHGRGAVGATRTYAGGGE